MYFRNLIIVLALLGVAQLMLTPPQEFVCLDCLFVTDDIETISCHTPTQKHTFELNSIIWMKTDQLFVKTEFYKIYYISWVLQMSVYLCLSLMFCNKQFDSEW